jgi:hypothetical protein
LGEVARSQAERAQLLRGYFEPTEEEREQRLKLPMPAHHAIARLVAGGFIRLILETNFDRLVETAIQETAGIVPTVISTPDALQGASTLDRSTCTVVKLHGDYLDTRIRNTEEELARYERPMARFLDRVLDEYGLIIVGWSGEWDTALRAALERRRSRRYGMYWATRSDPGEHAARLITQQGAEVIRIVDADTFLSDLADRVQAVADVQRQPPLAVDTAVATVKRYIVDPASVVRLNDLVMKEVEHVYELVGGEKLAVGAGTISAELVSGLAGRADAATEVLRAMVACGTYWESASPALWVRALQRLVNRRPPPTSINRGFDMRFLPALLVYYSAGIGAVAGGRYETLRAVLLDTKIAEYEREVPIVRLLSAIEVLEPRFGQLLPPRRNVKFPTSDYLEAVLRPTLQLVQVIDSEYVEAFDRFEYLVALVRAYEDLREGRGGWAPLGQYAWRKSIVGKVEREIAEQGVTWPATVLFQGMVNFDRVNEARAIVAELARPFGW